MQLLLVDDFPAIDACRWRRLALPLDIVQLIFAYMYHMMRHSLRASLVEGCHFLRMDEEGDFAPPNHTEGWENDNINGLARMVEAAPILVSEYGCAAVDY